MYCHQISLKRISMKDDNTSKIFKCYEFLARISKIPKPQNPHPSFAG
jgi:hypothetical protein